MKYAPTFVSGGAGGLYLQYVTAAAFHDDEDNTGISRSFMRYTKTPPPALPCPALPCPALPCPALPCPALPCPFSCEGPVYKLAFGPRSFIVVSDPVMAKHVLKSSVGDYDKGVLATVRRDRKRGQDTRKSGVPTVLRCVLRYPVCWCTGIFVFF